MIMAWGPIFLDIGRFRPPFVEMGRRFKVHAGRYDHVYKHGVEKVKYVVTKLMVEF